MNDKIFAVVPVKRFETSKSRLKFFLTEESRMRLTELLLTDTISTLINSNSVDTIVIVSGDERARLIGMEWALNSSSKILIVVSIKQ